MGIFPSKAQWRKWSLPSKASYVSLWIGVVSLLIYIFTSLFFSPSANFPLTVYVHGEAGPHEMVIKGSGYILLDLESERRREPIGGKGQAFFPEIPGTFRGKQVNIIVEESTYELAHPGKKFRLDGTSLYLAVRKKPGRITGRVQDEDGRPIAGTSITVAGLVTATDSSGRFDLTIPGNRMKKELSLQAVANGYLPWHSSVVPNANEVIVILRR